MGQSFDAFDNVINSALGENFEEVLKKLHDLEDAESGGILAKIIMAKVPQVGEKIEINGLKFIVTEIIEEKKEIHLRLLP